MYGAMLMASTSSLASFALGDDANNQKEENRNQSENDIKESVVYKLIKNFIRYLVDKVKVPIEKIRVFFSKALEEVAGSEKTKETSSSSIYNKEENTKLIMEILIKNLNEDIENAKKELAEAERKVKEIVTRSALLEEDVRLKGVLFAEKEDEMNRIAKEYDEKINREFDVKLFIEFGFTKDDYGNEYYLNKIKKMLVKVKYYELFNEKNCLEKSENEQNKNEYKGRSLEKVEEINKRIANLKSEFTEIEINNGIENDIQKFVEEVRVGGFIGEYVWQSFGTMKHEGTKKIYESYKLLSDISTVKDGCEKFIEGYKEVKKSIKSVIKEKDEQIEKLGKKKDEEISQMRENIAVLEHTYNDANNKWNSFCNDVKNKQVKEKEEQQMKVKRLESALKNEENFKSYVLDKYGCNSREYNFLLANKVNEKNSRNKPIQIGLESKLGQ